MLPGNQGKQTRQYAPDLIQKQTLAFMHLDWTERPTDDDADDY